MLSGSFIINVNWLLCGISGTPAPTQNPPVPGETEALWAWGIALKMFICKIN